MGFPDPHPKSGPWLSPPFPPLPLFSQPVLDTHTHTRPAFWSHFAHLFSPAFQCRSFLWITKVKVSTGSLDLQPLPPLTHPHAACSSKALGRNLQGSKNLASGSTPALQATPTPEGWSWSRTRLQTLELPSLPLLQTPDSPRLHTWGSCLLYRPQLARLGCPQV